MNSGILKIGALIGSVSLLALVSFSLDSPDTTLESIRRDLFNVKSGYLCLLPEAGPLSRQIASTLPEGEMPKQKEQLINCDKNYTDCCNKYIDGAWAYAIVGEDKALCRLVTHRKINIDNKDDVCVSAEDLVVNENSLRNFGIIAK